MADEYVDEVALERAAAGDVEVWRNLTRLERDLALIAARRRRLAELDERREWVDIFRRHAYGASGGDGVPHRYGSPEWLDRIAKAAGYKSAHTVMKQGRIAELRHEARLGG